MEIQRIKEQKKWNFHFNMIIFIKSGNLCRKFLKMSMPLLSFHFTTHETPYWMIEEWNCVLWKVMYGSSFATSLVNQ
jgi:hypothetical protein